MDPQSKWATVKNASSVIMDLRSWAERANRKYSNVRVTNTIKGNGRPALLLIGKTGAGKSSVRF